MESILICFNRFKALHIEISIFISSILVILFTTFGLLFIPFEIDSKFHKVLFSINLPISSIIILLSIIFIFFRLKYMINDKYNKYFYILSLGLIILCMIELLINLVNDSLIINNMYYNDYYYSKNKKKKKLSKTQWFNSIFILFILNIIFFSLILLALSQNLRIHLQIDGSFHNYILAIKLEEEESAKNKKIENDSEFITNIDKNDIKNKKQNIKEKSIKSSQLDLKHDLSVEVKIDNIK